VRRAAVVLLVFLLAAPACRAASPAAEGFAKGPYLQTPTQSAVTIVWASDKKADATVRYGVGKADRKAEGAPTVQKIDFPGTPYVDKGKVVYPPAQSEYVYELTLTKLKPGASYCYTVELGGQKSGGTFAIEPKKTKKFSFIAYGDSRSNPTIHAGVAGNFRRHNPAFILHVGDLVGSGAYREYGREFFAPLDDVIRYVPMWPARGNHEGDAVAYKQLFSLPRDELNYSFDYGNAHFTCVDSCDFARQKKILEWAEKDLSESKARWKIVFYHHPTYDVGSHRSDWGRNDFAPVFRKHGVDISLAGHTHVYERFRPMYTPGENDDHPITYIVTGGGGAGMYSYQESKQLAAASREFHYMLFTVEGDTLTGTTITAAGKKIDTFTISKPGGKYAGAYLDKAFSERDFIDP